MTTLSTSSQVRTWRWPTALGLALLATVRVLTVPRSLWEFDEMLFAGAVVRFDPLHHWPHPPGYPLFVAIAKAVNAMLGDVFVSLAAISMISSLVGYLALCAAFREWLADRAGAEALAVTAALLFHLSPAMLVQAPLALSDPPALMFLSIALLCAALLGRTEGRPAALALGAAASAAVGCRPQLAIAVLPMLVASCWKSAPRRRIEVAAAFGIVSLAWLVPLVLATGGPRGFLRYQLGQATYVSGHDALLSRGGATTAQLIARFVSHPWGPKIVAWPILAAAALGVVERVHARRTAALPLAALAIAQLAACLAWMDPADAVRYALPWMLGVAFSAVAGMAAINRLASRSPWPVVAAAGLALGAGAAHAWPVLAARRASDSPPAQAALWVRDHLPHDATVLAEPDLDAHARYLLRDYDVEPVEGGFDRAATRPERPLYLLSEGESGRPGAVTFRWPDSAAYRRLTRNHYRVVSLTPLRPGFVQGVRGVHGWEPSAIDARWRWLERAATLRIFPRGARGVALTLGLPESAAIEGNEVTVIADGAALAPFELRRGSTHRIAIPVAHPGPLFVGLRSQRSFVPRGPDARELAIQLLDVERLEDTP